MITDNEKPVKKKLIFCLTFSGFLFYNTGMNNEDYTCRLPSYDAIPEVGLYLEQVARFINMSLESYPEMNVTTAMISNYAKQKLIARVSKKTYSRQQIAALVMINLAKTVLSIEHVRFLLADIEKEDPEFESSYTFFVDTLMQVLASLADNREVSLASGDQPQLQQMLQSTAVAVAHKMFINRFFSLRKESQ